MPADLHPAPLSDDANQALDRFWTSLGSRADRVTMAPLTRLRDRALRRRQRTVALVVVTMLVVGAAAFGALRFGRPAVPPATPRPTVDFIPVRPAGQLPLETGGATSPVLRLAAIVGTNAYAAVWSAPGPLRIGSLALATGQPHFPTVDLGAWADVHQFDAAPEGLVVVGTPAGGSTEVLSVLDPDTGVVRWQQPIPAGSYDFARLYPAGVVISAGPSADGGGLWCLDWTDGARRWSLPVDSTLTAAARGWQPTTDTGAPFDALPQDPRLAVVTQADSGADVLMVDTTTGTTSTIHTGLSLGSRLEAAAGAALVQDQLYLAVNGPDMTRAGQATLWRLPTDGSAAPTRLWTSGPSGTLNGIVPAGPGRIGIIVQAAAMSTVVLDAATGREVFHSPNTVLGGGTAWGDRYLDPKGRVYDLSSRLLGDPTPTDLNWWLTAGSVLTVEVGPDRGPGTAQTGIVRSKSIVDGTTIDLGRITMGLGPVVVGGGYLVAAVPGGFQAWRFATG